MRQLFRKFKKDYQVYTKNRYLIISQANIALHKSKQAIFSLHRDQVFEAEKLLIQVEKILKKIGTSLKKAPDLKYNGAYKAALEEFLEAKLFYQVLKFGRIQPIKNLDINFDDYLAASCDLTGELVRKIILFVTKKEPEKAKQFKEFIAIIIEELIQFDLTGYLRHKFDEAKRNLKKAEEILYDLEIRKK